MFQMPRLEVGRRGEWLRKTWRSLTHSLWPAGGFTARKATALTRQEDRKMNQSAASRSMFKRSNKKTEFLQRTRTKVYALHPPPPTQPYVNWAAGAAASLEGGWPSRIHGAKSAQGRPLSRHGLPPVLQLHVGRLCVCVQSVQHWLAESLTRAEIATRDGQPRSQLHQETDLPARVGFLCLGATHERAREGDSMEVWPKLARSGQR